MLARSETGRAALKRKLAPHAESEDELEAVLDEMAARGWQSDARYAEAYIRSKSPKHGTLRLRRDLAQQGVDSDTVRALLPDDADETANAAAVLRKKFKVPPANYAEKQKQMRFLAYRGFDGGTIARALKQTWAEQSGGWDEEWNDGEYGD
ncbi:recombination regulator RecX [Kingella potus]|uniref:recombination regulator RecX n=1 Tax=Kingella potus TaxID=265175 RepID=UPI001FD2A0A4|nr:recombination regulator RecX [Kingella potus]UOP01835.1 recombination regulator RecX [Kingella potus]